MDVPGAAAEFKKEHPHNYWLRILCLAFSIVFVAMWVTGDVEGAVIQSTFNDTSDYEPQYRGNWQATHTKDDVLAISYISSDDKLMVAHRERGGSWEHDVVDDSGTTYGVGGIINTGNNTLVIQSSYIQITNLECHIFIKWPSSDWDDWYDLSIMTGGASYVHGDLAVNDEGLIGVLSGRSQSPVPMRWAEVNLTHPVTIVSGSGGTQTVGAGYTTDAYPTMQMFANLTGEWYWFYRSGSQHYMYGNDTGNEIISGANSYICDVALLENGLFIAAGQQSQTGYVKFYYQPTVSHEGAWTGVVASESPHILFRTNAIHISTRQNSTFVNLISFCDTHDEIITWGQQYDANTTEWKASMADTGVSDPDHVSMIGSFGAIWPVHPTTGIRWTLPNSGWVVIGRDENGATDALDVISDGVNWTVDLTTEDPEITTLTLPNAVYGEFYEHTLTKANGTTPYIWSLLIKPSWMSIGAVNGTIYGTPDGTGTEQIRAKLADAVPRYDEVQWTLTIGASSEGEGAGGIWDSMWLSGENCSSAGVLLLIIIFAIGIMAVVGSWER